MISCMNMITIVMHGRLYQAHSGNVKRTDTLLSLRDFILGRGWFQETMKRSHCSGNEEAGESSEGKTIPTSRE
jgi:hypothetical protein